MEIPDIAEWEVGDSDLAIYTIMSQAIEIRNLKEKIRRCRKQKAKVDEACGRYKYKIKKAIQYIESFEENPEYIDAYDITYWQDEVKEILKGDSNEELEKSKEIIGLKKGELQIELVKALVKIDKAIEHTRLKIIRYVNEQDYLINVCDLEELLEIYSSFFNVDKDLLEIIENDE